MTISRIAARAIMADLRNRNELHKILGPSDPKDGTPYIVPAQQEIIEARIAELIADGLDE